MHHLPVVIATPTVILQVTPAGKHAVWSTRKIRIQRCTGAINHIIPGHRPRPRIMVIVTLIAHHNFMPQSRGCGKAMQERLSVTRQKFLISRIEVVGCQRNAVTRHLKADIGTGFEKSLPIINIRPLSVKVLPFWSIDGSAGPHSGKESDFGAILLRQPGPFMHVLRHVDRKSNLQWFRTLLYVIQGIVPYSL